MKVRLYANHDGSKQTYFSVTHEKADQKTMYWFNVTTESGGTESKPYGFTTRERLETLRDELIELLK